MNLPKLPVAMFECRLEGHAIHFRTCQLGTLDVFAASEAQLQQDASLLFKRIVNADLAGRIITALNLQQPFSLDLQLRASNDTNGHCYWLQCAFTPHSRESGYACMMDITSQRAQLATTYKSTELFLKLQDHLEDIFYFKDRQSRILGGNRAFYEYHGETSIEALIGKTDMDSKRLPEQDKLALYQAEQELMATGGIWRKREHNWDMNGVEHYYESIKTPIRDDADQVIGVVGVTRDITDQVYAEMALKQAKQESDQANKAKSAFLAMISHEIRTPMNGVLGCASLLAETPLDANQQQLLATIKTSGDALLIIINDILDYSKIEAGKMQLEYTEFALADLIEQCLELFSKDAEAKNLNLNSWLAPEVPPVVMGDPTRVRQLICNLISNAIKFTPSGEVMVEVKLQSLTAETSHCELLIQIRDTGIGIAKDKQSKLFEAFTQADDSVTREFGGTGLGLVICKRLVELMGGDIAFTSTEGEGTTFNVRLHFPYRESLGEQQPQRHLGITTGKDVLIIDDNATNRMILVKHCSSWHMHIRSAANTAQAFALLQSGLHFDVILLDYCLPNQHGGEFARTLKHNPSLANIPIILLSSINTPKEYQQYFNQCLLKPIRGTRLLDAICQALDVQGAPKPKQPQPLAADQTNQVLVAEDNEVNQMILRSMLHKLGYKNVTLTDNGSHAVAACSEQAFDLVLMDLQMPIMDGIEATKRIRALPMGTPPWIVAVSASALKEDQERAFNAGVNAFIAKPITLESLQALLNKTAPPLQRH